MLEKALTGTRTYWIWIFFLLAIMGAGAAAWFWQLNVGLTITGLSRDVVWGFYIAQFTFLVGVAASAVMVVLPYYLHNYKAFGKMTILGEFLAIAAVIMCMSFIFVDMGRPDRIFNVFLYPTPHSMMFWDTVALGGYLVLNILISRVTLSSERRGEPPPSWIKPVILLSIPWAVSIHTVTAFLYSGLAARPFWMTAILAPRFLASAFAAGPALLILLAFVVRRLTKFDPGKEAINKLAEIVTYAMIINVFFVLMEVFTALYSNIPEHIHHFEFLFTGIEGNTTMAPWMWLSVILAIVALVILINPTTRRAESTLIIGCIAVFGSLWIDKGLGMVIAGFVPSPLGKVVSYTPTIPELTISLAIYAMGLLIVTGLYKIALEVRGQIKA
ncbi:MAG TPA: NrfD/PsrC family molybdoenzyme membrane anchor subunit [Methylomirabilota bacterium]|jgi:molybdopterin-containing oxidoreductase family membrane subunit|nr:NrfD/PsrC family molybdoenzyme membrane anchor subunit [Methylomirabilota bacterium]